MAKIKGDSIRFYKNSTVLELEMEVNLTANNDLIQTTDKAGLWKNSISSQRNWSASGTANIDFTNDYNISQMFDNFKIGDLITVSIGSTSNKYTGTGLLSSWSVKPVRNNISKFSFNLIGNSVLSELSYFNFGNTEIGTTERFTGFGIAYAFTPDGNGQIEKGYFYGRATVSNPARLIAGIYDTVAGKPTNLVGRTTDPQPLTDSNEWQSVTFETPVLVTSGTTYWLVFDDTSGGVLYHYQIASTGGNLWTCSFDQTYPDPMVTHIANLSWSMSMYVEGSYT